MEIETETLVPVRTAPTLASLLRAGCEGTYQAVEHYAYRSRGALYLCGSAAIYYGAGMVSMRGSVIEKDGTETLVPISGRSMTGFQRSVCKRLGNSPPPPPPGCDHIRDRSEIDTEDLIVHLNDEHRWPRERIAMYLEEWER